MVLGKKVLKLRTLVQGRFNSDRLLALRNIRTIISVQFDISKLKEAIELDREIYLVSK